jgi:hypothetical protein
VSLNAVTRLERDEVDPRMNTVPAVEKALTKAGITFRPNDKNGRRRAIYQHSKLSGAFMTERME